ncbi:MAG: hypothetical protein RLZZ453_1170 [Chlamydiota bacterium]|jgi:hypothetical protein
MIIEAIHSIVQSVKKSYALNTIQVDSPSHLPRSDFLPFWRLHVHFGHNNYRENLIAFTGKSPSPNRAHAHHVFARIFKKKFQLSGININDPCYLTWWSAKNHLDCARDYNKEWIKFFTKHPYPSKGKILKAGRKIMALFGQKTHYPIPSALAKTETQAIPKSCDKRNSRSRRPIQSV